MKLLSGDDPLEDRLHGPVIDSNAIQIRLDPFARVYGRPIQRMTRTQRQLLEQNALDAPVSFAKWVNHIEFAIMLGQFAAEGIATKSPQPSVLGHGIKAT